MSTSPSPKLVRSVDELAELVASRRSDSRCLTAIAGAPGSGKSTTAELLVESLNAGVPDSAAVLAMDGYHYDDRVLNERGWRSRKGAPHTFDVGGLAQMLARLRTNDEAEVAVPVFDRSLEIARAGARIIPCSVTHVVVEGNYLLLEAEPWSGLARLFDTTVFIDVSEAELRRRLLDRWSGLSGRALSEQLDGNDMINVRLIRSHRRAPDVLFRPLD